LHRKQSIAQNSHHALPLGPCFASLVDRLIMMCVWAMAMQLQRLPKCAAAKPDDR
jgi:hypothetical protein